ncbi:4-phosphopantetheinyl transferase family protein [Flavobacterium circumlabens]|uniref:4'-phosphopantetheinyl transferase superfamily protein n=1 Tax=Flavobacterium circumlabens TaxID=2133765 RepID=A0A4Y7U852_9FLAO|nr:4'-phosphopantetheinyl transferase superfamily protein [Flavobacterium circumlabens]TCN53043.1 4'-phosphopantetheinyl transferase superfamily protein [Flavobacterium circumlabens]TEB42401.1 4-phosphopantetheinyl transferase family protein [Flavobacterium circumlabens]
MIGNDVIDLIQTRQESNWQRKGFLEKLFTAEEQSLIAQQLNPERMVWVFWSMKEAAYKIYNRQTRIRAYMPLKLVCSLDSESSDCISGKVSCCGNLYFTQTIFTPDCLHTIAVTTPHQWSTVTEIEKKNIEKDEYGIPFLFSPLSPNGQAVSISHHGRFEKVVCLSA